MADTAPVGELDSRFSSDEASAFEWQRGQDALGAAEVFWLSTVRPDGRPHVTPVLAAWLDGAMYISCGVDERKAHNIAANPQCVLTTGSNELDKGLDMVVEGRAERVVDEAGLQRIAAGLGEKYGAGWTYTVRDGKAIGGSGGEVAVFEVTPAKAFGFGRGVFNQTRWRF
jgi:nitroimidazol reductase NimA-like FMN-containing flavoprotein (pyridoxamine 5'-phosphate oxidase superfamily)